MRVIKKPPLAPTFDLLDLTDDECDIICRALLYRGSAKDKNPRDASECKRLYDLIRDVAY